MGKIMNSNPERSFDGYVSKSANEKKIIRDVWTKGDSAFSSGYYCYVIFISGIDCVFIALRHDKYFFL